MSTVEGMSDDPPPCFHCGCPWNSCLVHTDFCCDTCAHFDPPTEVPF